MEMSATRESDATRFWVTLLVASSVFASVRGGMTSGANEINFNRNESVFRLTVIHINDMHSRFEQVNSVSNKCSTQDAEARNCYGGFARVKSASRTARFEAERAGRNVLFLNAGDTYQGTPYYNLFKWKIVAPLVEKMEFDAMALGNHEFDDGPNGLHPFLQNISAPTLACNVDISDEPSMNVTNLMNSIMFNFTNFKVGVVGYLTPETAIVAKPEGVKFLPEIPEIQRETDKLRKDGANIVIALGHSGYDKDKRIAEQVEGIDLVIGGHSHSLLHNGSQPSTERIVGNYPTVIKQKTGKKVLVVQAYAFTKYLGIINLDYSNDGHLLSYEGNTKLLDSSVEEDVEILEELEPWRGVINKKSHTKLGKTKVFLDASSDIRKGESNLANFVCDAFIDYYLRKFETPAVGWTDTAIALIQAGGLRNSIEVTSSGGDVTFVDLITTMPFEDSLFRMTLKGKYLQEALEWGVRNLREDNFDLDGSFLHSSGLKVEFDMKNAPGSRVVKLLARCSECSVPEYLPVEMDKEYGILTTTYLAGGGDGFQMFKDNHSSLLLLLDKDTDIVTDYLKRLSPIYPAKEGRITVKNFNTKDYYLNNEISGARKHGSFTLYSMLIAVSLQFIFYIMEKILIVV